MTNTNVDNKPTGTPSGSDMAYTAGRAIRGLADRFNKAIDDVSDTVQRAKTDSERRIEMESESRPSISPIRKKALILANRMDEDAIENNGFGPGRAVAMDFPDGSTSRRFIHDNQNSRSAMEVMTEILLNKVKNTMSDGWEIKCISLDSANVIFAISNGDFIEVKSVAVIHVVRASGESAPVTNRDLVPYNPKTDEWPWDQNDIMHAPYAAIGLRGLGDVK